MRIKKYLTVYSGLPKGVYCLFWSDVVNRMGCFIMPLITLILTEKIGLSKPQAGLFVTIALVSQAPFIVLGGKLADGFGSKKTIVLFHSLGAIVYAACAFLKPGMTVAVLIVVASSLYAIAQPAFNAIVVKITPAPQVKSAFSLAYLGHNLGMAIGPAIAGLLFANHLNLLFAIDALTTLAAMAMVAWWVHETKAEELPDDTTDISGAQGPQTGSLYRFLSKNTMLLAFSAVMLVYNFCYMQWNFLLPLQTVDVFGAFGVKFYSLLFGLNAITVIALTPILTSVTQKIRPLALVCMGGMLYASAFALFAVDGFATVFVAAILVLTVGEIIIVINTNSYIAHRTPKTLMGRMSSLFAIVNGFGSAIGPVIMGNVLVWIGFGLSWAFVSVLMVFAAAGMFVMLKREKATSACLQRTTDG